MSETAGAHDPVLAGALQRRRARGRDRTLVLVGLLVVVLAGRALGARVAGEYRVVADAVAAALPALVLGVWVAWSARRHREEAHPARATLATFLLFFLVSRAADWVNGAF